MSLFKWFSWLAMRAINLAAVWIPERNQFLSGPPLVVVISVVELNGAVIVEVVVVVVAIAIVA